MKPRIMYKVVRKINNRYFSAILQREFMGPWCLEYIFGKKIKPYHYQSLLFVFEDFVRASRWVRTVEGRYVGSEDWMPSLPDLKILRVETNCKFQLLKPTNLNQIVTDRGREEFRQFWIRMGKSRPECSDMRMITNFGGVKSLIPIKEVL